MRILLRLLTLLRPYLGATMLASITVVLSSGFALVTPRLVSWAVDFGITRGKSDIRALAVISLAILASAVASGVFRYCYAYLGESTAQRVAYDLREQIYNRLQRLSYAYHDKAQVGQIMSRVTQDVEAVRMYVNQGTLRLADIGVKVIGSLWLIAQLNFHLSIITFIFVPILAGQSVFMSTRLRPYWTRIQDGMGILGTILQENLTAMRVVKAFSREDYESAKFARSAQTLFDDSFHANQIQSFNMPTMIGVWTLSIVITLFYGGHLYLQGQLTIGELAACMLYLQIIQGPMRQVGFIVNQFARSQAAGERIYEILDAESAVKEKPDAVELKDSKGEVIFDRVSFGYDAVSAVLRDVDIVAKPGEIIALLGPTGSGKSTVVNLLPRFYDVTGGRIVIDGHDIRDLTLASLRNSIGIVQQEIFLFIDTIRENIRYGVQGASDEEVIEAAKVARIHDFIMTLPDGYDTWVGERGVTLSGGQKQRISIARMLLRDPRILVFDDSTSSVDMETEYLIQQALNQLMEGRTTFVIAQRLRTVKNADQILVLRNGQIVEQGRHEELLEKNGLYRQIYDVELRDQEEAFAQSTLAANAEVGDS
ncbi:MAG TPA: ABC transporter ATP-binding protein [Dehalococcoidia bacterium]|nr:ABC transporter ATP-binding protein [Dehalococcoidia bacterium]